MSTEPKTPLTDAGFALVCENLELRQWLSRIVQLWNLASYEPTGDLPDWQQVAGSMKELAKVALAIGETPIGVPIEEARLAEQAEAADPNNYRLEDGTLRRVGS